MESFEKIIIEKGKKYLNRFYPLLLENNLFLRKKYKSILNKVCLENDSCILDLGCGTGIYSIFLKEYCRIVYGVDRSHVLIKEASLATRQRCGIKVLVSEAESLPFDKEMFDLVFVNDSLIHFTNQENALMQIKDVLKNNGKAIFIEPNIINPVMMLTLLFFKNGWRNFRRNITRTQLKLSHYFIIEEVYPFNLIYTKDKWKISLLRLFDKITSFSWFSFFSFRYVIIASKLGDKD